jgi:hypothetical protein
MKPEKGADMVTITADSASLGWDSKKKNWAVSIRVGAEVVHRSPDPAIARDAGDEELRTWVIQTAKDEGYEIAAERVKIER